MSGARRVVVTGIGLVSPLGTSAEAFNQALVSGESGLSVIETFATEELPFDRGGQVANFDPATLLGKRNLRPLDRTARLAAVAAQEALAKGGWAVDDNEAPAELGLVLGTMFGSVHTISAFDRRAMTAGPQYAKPMDFANSVINAAAGQTAIWHHLRGMNTTIAGGPTAGLQALAYATDQIRTGRCDALLAGGADELCFESFLGYSRAGLLCGSSNGTSERNPVPFDAARNGFTLGEGGALFLLEEAEAAKARGASILVEITGSGTAYDTARSGEDGRGAVARAIRLTLDEAKIQSEQVEAVSTSASGSIEGDRLEAEGIAEALGSEHSRSVPITAIKGAVGECLGASGGFQAAARLSAIRGESGAGMLSGIHGLDQADPRLPLSGMSPLGQPLEASRGLITSLGLSGRACALLLERWRDN